MLSYIQRAQRRRRYERSSSYDDTGPDSTTPPPTPESPKVEGFRFSSSTKRNNQNECGNSKLKGFMNRRQLSEPSGLKEQNSEKVGAAKPLLKPAIQTTAEDATETTKLQDEDPKALALKENLRSLKTSFSKICDLFEKIVDFNHNPTSESAKRRLDLEIDRLKALKEQCESADPAQVKQLSSEDVPEYDKYYILHVNSILSDIKSIRTDLVGHIQEKTEAEENIAKENFKLRLDLQREQAESMHQRQNHDYAVTEKNTVLATCRKLEEQLDERSRQIQQLQREGTVSLWQREKAKVVQDIKSKSTLLIKVNIVYIKVRIIYIKFIITDSTIVWEKFLGQFMLAC
ncbi:predicted protein [Nematostella vectensis]|uniref:Uncharacterized protein n=1 Tax=Nematostella vectensis TaxID=45351 RepID=A7RTI3_NEMVE|nr:predicted protein [Nematostella vectensis]|eukprot:XP_001637331.1 predicted protein [Nematostella vectensis]